VSQCLLVETCLFDNIFEIFICQFFVQLVDEWILWLNLFIQILIPPKDLLAKLTIEAESPKAVSSPVFSKFAVIYFCTVNGETRGRREGGCIGSLCLLQQSQFVAARFPLPSQWMKQCYLFTLTSLQWIGHLIPFHRDPPQWIRYGYPFTLSDPLTWIRLGYPFIFTDPPHWIRRGYMFTVANYSEFESFSSSPLPTTVNLALLPLYIYCSRQLAD